MQKTEVHVTTKTGQNKASPIESEIHPSHKTPFYALCISRLHRARRSYSQVHLARAAYPRGFAPRIALAGGRHLRKYASKRCLFSPATMGFPFRNRIRKTHARSVVFCRKTSRFRLDDFAIPLAALSARKRAYVRNRSPKVALVAKTSVTSTERKPICQDIHLYVM